MKIEMDGETFRQLEEFVMSRRDDIEKDMENFGLLKRILRWFLGEI